MPGEKLTEAQRRVLSFVANYGPCVGFADRETKARDRNAAKALVASGLLAGSHRSASITEAGRSALAREGE